MWSLVGWGRVWSVVGWVGVWRVVGWGGVWSVVGWGGAWSVMGWGGVWSVVGWGWGVVLGVLTHDAPTFHSLSILQYFKYVLHTTDEDFIISGGIPQTIQFGRFEMSKEFDVTILDDNIGEGMELIILELRSVEDNMISVTSDQRTTEITIIEEDSKIIK